jgi:hypothetical protein
VNLDLVEHLAVLADGDRDGLDGRAWGTGAGGTLIVVMSSRATNIAQELWLSSGVVAS